MKAPQNAIFTFIFSLLIEMCSTPLPAADDLRVLGCHSSKAGGEVCSILVSRPETIEENASGSFETLPPLDSDLNGAIQAGSVPNEYIVGTLITAFNIETRGQFGNWVATGTIVETTHKSGGEELTITARFDGEHNQDHQRVQVGDQCTINNALPSKTAFSANE